jgi:thioredoxin 1
MNKVIKFGAPWCGGCNTMKPMFEKFKEEAASEAVEILDINVDTDPEAASKFGVQSIPFTVFIKGGEVVKAVKGVMNTAKLHETYKEIFA